MTRAAAEPPATAEGTLARTPFPHLLVYIADRVLSGSLRLLSHRDGEPLDHVVYFEGGAPAKVQTGEPIAYLGRVLFETGHIDEPTLNRSLLEIAKTRELHGEYLVRTGAISRAVLRAALQAQALRKLAHLFQLPSDTKFAFYADVNLLERWGGAELFALDPLPLIWNAVRIQPDERVVEATLGRLGQAMLRMHPDSDANRFGFDPAELAAVNLLRASPQTLDSLLACDLGKSRAVRLVVYTLVVTRHIDHGGNAVPVGLTHGPGASNIRISVSPGARARRALQSRDPGDAAPAPPGPTVSTVTAPPVTSAGEAARAPTPSATGAGEAARAPTPSATGAGEAARAPTPSATATGRPQGQSAEVHVIADVPGGPARPILNTPPAGLSPDLQARRTAILERARSIDQEDYFMMLGIERGADERAIQTAYFALAKTWHPDRVPAELGLVRFEASKVFARMNEAYEVLFDATRRARYLEVLKGGTGTPEEAESIQRIVNATADFQRAEVYYRKHDYANALDHIKRAYEADSDQAHYAALYALVLLMQRTSPDDPLSDVASMLERAIEAEPRCERAYIARAQLRRRLGQVDSAMADFRHIAELNPKNVDAVREVRLYEMRNPRRSPSRGSDKPSPGVSRRPKPPNSSGPEGKRSGVFAGFQKLFKR